MKRLLCKAEVLEKMPLVAPYYLKSIGHTVDPSGHGPYVTGLHFKPSMLLPSTSPAPRWPRLLPSSLEDYTSVTAPLGGLAPVQTLPIHPDPAQVMAHLFYDDFFGCSSELFVSSKVICEALTPNMMVLGGGASGSA